MKKLTLLVLVFSSLSLYANDGSGGGGGTRGLIETIQDMTDVAKNDGSGGGGGTRR